MEQLWSMSTTVREAERIVGFLKTACELNGVVWNHENQIKFQVLLIKNRQYLVDADNAQVLNNLNNSQQNLIKDKSIDMSYEEAKGIFDAKQYEDPPMRGRQSMAPLQKLGLVNIVVKDNKKIVQVSDVGVKLANGQIKFEDFMLDSLLKYQYPNPSETSYKNWNTKPFINTLRLIKAVNKLCKDRGEKEKGISTLEFGIFALSLKSYSDVEETAKKILDFRKQYQGYDEEERKTFAEEFIKTYLKDFKNPVSNVREYTDNMVRYLRLTKYIYIRGKYSNTYIDLEPRRMTEIDAILQVDNGSAREYTLDTWMTYMGIYGSYELPFETVEKLTQILNGVTSEIDKLETDLAIPHALITAETTSGALKESIEKARKYRNHLQNLALRKAYHNDITLIDGAVESLSYIRDHNKAKLAKKYSIELEKWANVALNIIDDAVDIIPNAPMGDDNEPIYTAPNNVADIECQYLSFGAVCEVTMLTSRDQWYNEGQPVMRHLRTFENVNNTKPVYCLFIAPSLHADTINTFYTSVKYEYDGVPQKIIPITITQLMRILEVVKNSLLKGQKFSHKTLMNFYDNCIAVSTVKNTSEWLALIEQSLVKLEAA